MPRPDGRSANALRPIGLERRANPYAEDSCLIRMGGTLVLCTASVEETVPPWRKGSGQGRLVAAVSVGMVDGEPRVDLSYFEDKAAAVDANVVVAEPDRHVELQGTGEQGTFDRRELDCLLALAAAGLEQLFAAQRRALGG